MGYTPSSSTQTLYAYLTQKGRINLLFSSATDSQVKYFTLHDDDINYSISSLNSNTNKLPKGFVPDITGDNDDCIRSVAQAHFVDESNYLIWGGTLAPPPSVPPPSVPPPSVPPPSVPPPSVPPPSVPPPSGQRALPLILEFEYPTNYSTTSNKNDVWVHQRIADPNDGTTYRSRLGQNVKIYNAANPGGTPLDDQDPRFEIVLRTSPGDTSPITQAERDAVKFNLNLTVTSPIANFFSTTTDQINRFGGGGAETNYVSFSYNEGQFRTAAQFISRPNPGTTNVSNFVSNYSFSSITIDALSNRLTTMYLYWDGDVLNGIGDVTLRRYFQFKFTITAPNNVLYQVNTQQNEYEYRGAIIKQI
jgi:hypothetical protein